MNNYIAYIYSARYYDNPQIRHFGIASKKYAWFSLVIWGEMIVVLLASSAEKRGKTGIKNINNHGSH